MRGLVGIYLANRVLDTAHERERLDRRPDDERLARVNPLVFAPILREVLAQGNVDGRGLLGEEAKRTSFAPEVQFAVMSDWALGDSTSQADDRFSLQSYMLRRVTRALADRTGMPSGTRIKTSAAARSITGTSKGKSRKLTCALPAGVEAVPLYSINNAEAFAATKAVLVDQRDAVAPSLAFVDQVIGVFQSHEEQLGNARVGMVTSETLAFGMSRMVELKPETSLPSAAIRVFRDHHTATRWLTRRDATR